MAKTLYCDGPNCECEREITEMEVPNSPLGSNYYCSVCGQNLNWETRAFRGLKNLLGNFMSNMREHQEKELFKMVFSDFVQGEAAKTTWSKSYNDAYLRGYNAAKEAWKQQNG
jgi:hypothetical protein